jgi:hypothetical protein
MKVLARAVIMRHIIVAYAQLLMIKNKSSIDMLHESDDYAFLVHPPTLLLLLLC